MTKNTAKSRGDVADEVKTHFSEQEFVEMTFVASYFNMRNRYHDSLDLPIDNEDTVRAGTKGLRRDPTRLKEYFYALLDKWPDEFPKAND